MFDGLRSSCFKFGGRVALRLPPRVRPQVCCDHVKLAIQCGPKVKDQLSERLCAVTEERIARNAFELANVDRNLLKFGHCTGQAGVNWLD